MESKIKNLESKHEAKLSKHSNFWREVEGKIFMKQIFFKQSKWEKKILKQKEAKKIIWFFGAKTYKTQAKQISFRLVLLTRKIICLQNQPWPYTAGSPGRAQCRGQNSITSWLLLLLGYAIPRATFPHYKWRPALSKNNFKIPSRSPL